MPDEAYGRGAFNVGCAAAAAAETAAGARDDDSDDPKRRILDGFASALALADALVGDGATGAVDDLSRFFWLEEPPPPPLPLPVAW